MNHDPKIVRLIDAKVDAFASLMKERMLANSHKGSWKNTHFAELFLLASTQMGHLSESLLGRGVGGKMQVPLEAADVANLMMLITDVVWELPGDDVMEDDQE
jgi:hypothetical protein